MPQLLQVPLLDVSGAQDLAESFPEDIDLDLDLGADNENDNNKGSDGLPVHGQRPKDEVARRRKRDSRLGGFCARLGWLAREARSCPTLAPYLGRAFESQTDLDAFQEQGVAFAVQESGETLLHAGFAQDIAVDLRDGRVKRTRLGAYALPWLAGRMLSRDSNWLVFAAPETVKMARPGSYQDPAALFAPWADIWALGMILVSLFRELDHVAETEAEAIARLTQLARKAADPGSHVASYVDDVLPTDQLPLDTDFVDFLCRCLHELDHATQPNLEEAENRADHDKHQKRLVPGDQEGPALAEQVRNIIKLQQVMLMLSLRREHAQLRVELQKLVDKMSKAEIAPTRGIAHQSGVNISASVRALTWLGLLGVPLAPAPPGGHLDAISGAPLRIATSAELEYSMLQPLLRQAHEVDNQLQQDVPRCHQYHPVLRSGELREQVRRVLKAWVVSHPQGAYWQGMDSIAAALCALYPGDEAVSFAAFDRLVAQHLPGLFLRSKARNTRRIHSRLSAVEQMLAFHDPQLAAHLRSLGVESEHFALPWVLTMFAHVLPVGAIWRMWDFCLARAPGRGLVLLSVAVLVELRDVLLSYHDFGDAVGFLTRLPVSLDRLVHRCLKLARAADRLTPDLTALQGDRDLPSGTSPRLCGQDALDEVRDRALLVEVVSSATSRQSGDAESAADDGLFHLADLRCGERSASKDAQRISAALEDSVRGIEPSKHLIVLTGADEAAVHTLATSLVSESRLPFVCLLPRPIESIGRHRS
ncbi:TBC domain-containing protein kinase-like protein [Hondaea fermentalgiana]|uniref:TBC domain-containing protein kinase-like protein n=1 Tax=Hondaea fermentalgiana TaxID=2315210 RepID=A0A2R5G2L7_9STRA|nr:TBC domain-containing protein kinase-like protein [Hondaea fermentalgiana]|eukprot:GBG25242.1 TBC domain-containing protein kinase-like protein [Hondaea fermentalgiana]